MAEDQKHKEYCDFVKATGGLGLSVMETLTVLEYIEDKMSPLRAECDRLREMLKEVTR